jgi:CheY-like chemotaxis protein
MERTVGHHDTPSVARAERPRNPVLVVEDDAATRESVMALLHWDGYETAGAGDGLAALDLLREGGVSPCLILLDLMMPVMDGWQFRAAQRADPALASIPVIVFSARLGAANAVGSLQVAAALTKPVDSERLLDLVEQHCHARTSPDR